jgi:hypothetical protein
MCCFFASLFLFGPRLAFLVYWLFPYGQLKIAATFNTFWWPFLGLIFLPWTTLMYTILYTPGAGFWSGIMGFDWIWLGFAFFADIAGYAVGTARRKDAAFYTGP